MAVVETREIELINSLSIKTIGQISLHEPEAARETLFRIVSLCEEVERRAKQQGEDAK